MMRPKTFLGVDVARLTDEQWEKARAEYEARGISLREVARRYGVAESAVRKKARAQGWEPGKSAHLVEKKMTAIKADLDFEAESAHLSRTSRQTIESVARERLEAEGITASFAAAIARRGILLAAKADAGDLESLSRAHKNITPQVQDTSSTTVNINQTQQQANIPTPLEVMARLVESAREDDDG